MEETWNKTPDEILYISREWMINALTDGISEPVFYDVMLENLPSPLPKYRRNESRWDWSESKVDEATFNEFLGLVEKHISEFVETMWQKNSRLGKVIQGREQE
tara:strand:- start:2405 stop:2713 length:309 start_codon:yes stop_codon:yes gene_type:complete